VLAEAITAEVLVASAVVGVPTLLVRVVNLIPRPAKAVESVKLNTASKDRMMIVVRRIEFLTFMQSLF